MNNKLMVEKKLSYKNKNKEMSMNFNKYYIEALKSKYTSQKSEALANLSIYLSSKNLAAIGEHSDLLTEQDNWVEKWANAEDKLQSLEKIVNDLSDFQTLNS